MSSNLDDSTLESSNLNGSTSDSSTLASSAETKTWQLNAVTEALGDLTLTVSDTLSIGRGSDNDVVLGSKEVSRNHALLSVLYGQLYVKDLNSSNGTFINEVRADGNQSKYLKANDTVSFASFVFRVVAPIAQPESTEQPTAAPVIDSPVTDSVTDNADDHDSVVADVTATKIDAEATTEASSLEPTSEAPSEKPTTELSHEPITEAATVVDDSILEETAATQPVVKQTIIEEVLAPDSSTENVPVAPDQQSNLQKAVKEEAVNEKAIEPQVPQQQPKQDVSAESAVITPDTDMPVKTETANIETAKTETPTYKEAEVMTETTPTKEPADTSNAAQDKTTTTTLQEEADPEVLRAKQAATGQFSGTANLGQPKDLGTQGNNALDQAINNPANAGQTEKKPSGSWFIWVFAIIIIIALALWLFNMGAA